MKAMLLAAGEGRRLRPLTLETPKPLLKVGGKALIVYHLEALADAGITEVVINVAYLAEQIKNTLGDGSRWGLSIQYSNEEKPLETAGGIAHAAHLLGSEPFLLVSSDIWTDFPLRPFVNGELQLAANEEAKVVLVNNPEHNIRGDFSIDENSRLTSRGDIAFTYSGVSVLRLDAVLNCPGREEVFPLREVFFHLIAKQKISALHYEGRWTDVGTQERLQTLEGELRRS